MKKSIFLTLIVILLTIFISSCAQKYIPVISFKIISPDVIMYEEELEELGYEFTPSNATNQYIFWSTLNHKVATVDNKGIITATGPGTTKVIAETYDGAFVSTRNIIVYAIERPVSSILINGEKESFFDANYGEVPITLKITVLPEKADNKNYTLSSSNPNVVSVIDNELLKYNNVGTAIITAMTQDGGHTATLTITVNAGPTTSLSVDRTKLYGAVGAKCAYVRPVFSNTVVSDKTVLWESLNPGIATVDNTGRVEFVSKGSTTLTVKTPDNKYSASCSVIVVDPIILHTAEDIQNIDTMSNALDEGKYYLLGNDIDFSTSTITNFDPIGFDGGDSNPGGTLKFNGVFDGNGYVIDKLTISRSGEFNIGLFVYIGALGNVRNVTLTNTVISGRIASPICGTNEGIVENCFFEASITASLNWNSCIVATNGTSGKVYNCISNSSITDSTANYAVAGRNYGYIENCYVNSDLLPITVINNPLVNKMTTNAVIYNSSLITTAQLKLASTFISFPNTLWMFEDGSMPKIRK